MAQYTVQELKTALRAGVFTDLGGYPTYFITESGNVVSHEGVRKKFREYVQALIDDSWYLKSWRISHQEINYDDGELICDETNKRIPSAYAETEND